MVSKFSAACEQQASEDPAAALQAIASNTILHWIHQCGVSRCFHMGNFFPALEEIQYTLHKPNYAFLLLSLLKDIWYILAGLEHKHFWKGLQRINMEESAFYLLLLLKDQQIPEQFRLEGTSSDTPHAKQMPL